MLMHEKFCVIAFESSTVMQGNALLWVPSTLYLELHSCYEVKHTNNSAFPLYITRTMDHHSEYHPTVSVYAYPDDNPRVSFAPT